MKRVQLLDRAEGYSTNQIVRTTGVGRVFVRTKTYLEIFSFWASPRVAHKEERDAPAVKMCSAEVFGSSDDAVRGVWDGERASTAAPIRPVIYPLVDTEHDSP